MHQHISNEPPSLLPLVWVIDEQLGDGSIGLRMPFSSVVAEEHDFHQGDEDHADSWWPAAVLFFVGTVY